MYFGLDKFLIISGKRENKEVTPLHKNINGMDSNFVNILPVIHTLAGCYKTSKVGKKTAASQAAVKWGYNLSYSFGKSEISDQVILTTEKLLFECFSKKNLKYKFLMTYVLKDTIKNLLN